MCNLRILSKPSLRSGHIEYNLGKYPSELIANGDISRDVLRISAKHEGRNGIAHRLAAKTGIAYLGQTYRHIAANDEMLENQVHAAEGSCIPAVELWIAHAVTLLIIGTAIEVEGVAEMICAKGLMIISV